MSAFVCFSCLIEDRHPTQFALADGVKFLWSEGFLVDILFVDILFETDIMIEKILSFRQL